MRRTIAVAAGLLALVALAVLPSTASAQYVPPPTTATTTTTVLGTSTVPTTTTTTTEAPTTAAEETTTSIAPAQVTPTTEQVLGAVVRRPLPRTGNDIGGTAVFGGALTVLGVALALGARRRRNSFDGV